MLICLFKLWIELDLISCQFELQIFPFLLIFLLCNWRFSLKSCKKLECCFLNVTYPKSPCYYIIVCPPVGFWLWPFARGVKQLRAHYVPAIIYTSQPMWVYSTVSLMVVLSMDIRCEFAVAVIHKCSFTCHAFDIVYVHSGIIICLQKLSVVCGQIDLCGSDDWCR